MPVTSISFKNRNQHNFKKELKNRVDQYFDDNNLSRHANASMLLKTGILLTIYFGSYGIIISGIASAPAMLGLCFTMGIGIAGIGFSVSHDALHGAYSSNKTVNKILGLSFDMLGANGYISHYRTLKKFGQQENVFN